VETVHVKLSVQSCRARRLGGEENKDAKYAWEGLGSNDHLKGRMGRTNVT
jgi:hypothetical protein